MTERTSSGGEFSDGDFDTFLMGTVNEFEERAVDELVTAQIKSELDTLLDTCGVPTVYRFDQEHREALKLSADSDLRENTFDDAVQLKRVFAYLWASQKLPQKLSPATAKARIASELFVHADCKKDSPWMTLADKLLPDEEPLDFSSIEDLLWVSHAIRAKEKRSYRKQLLSDTVLVCLRNLLQEADGSDIGGRTHMAALGRCALIYIKNDHQKEAEIDDVVRTSGLPRESILAMVGAYKQCYDAAGGFFVVDLL